MWSDGPVILGVPWQPRDDLIRHGSDLATIMGVHLACAFVDPASYLAEWEPATSRPGISLEPAASMEGDFPDSEVRASIQNVLGPPGLDWSFRVLHGDVANALARLAESSAASILVVGGQRPGRIAGMSRWLEGSVSLSLIRNQARPVVVVPWLGP